MIRAFLLTRLLRGVTQNFVTHTEFEEISTHTPLARRDRAGQNIRAGIERFLLTRLLRGVTACRYKYQSSLVFLLTRLLRGVTYLCRNP